MQFLFILENSVETTDFTHRHGLRSLYMVPGFQRTGERVGIGSPLDYFVSCDTKIGRLGAVHEFKDTGNMITRFIAMMVTSAWLPLVGYMAVDPAQVPPPPVATKEPKISVTPKVDDKSRPVVFSAPWPLLSRQLPKYVDRADDVIERIHRALKEIRLLELWSLDPSVLPEQEKLNPSRPYRFHEFHSIGREELKGADAMQKLLLSVTRSISLRPSETYDCFVPRHGLRIYDQKGFIDVLLCYSCLQGIIYEGNEATMFATAAEAEADFDAVFSKLNLRKAD